MAQNSFALMTNLGRAKEAAAIANGTAVVITHIAIGDGATVPSGGETTLYHEIARKTVSGHGTVTGAANVAYFDIFLAAAEGPYTIREAGLIDQDGALIAIARYDPPINKPIPSSGQTVEGTVRLEVAFSNIANVTIVVDPTFKVPMQRLSRLPWLPVISMSATVPPASPVIGDVYLIPIGATGAWTGQGGKIAEYTAAGWGVITPPDGHGISLPDGRVFERVNGIYVEFLASREWVNSRKTPIAQLNSLPWLPVKSMTLTAPPAATEGDLYLIPASATGLWTGKAGQIAEWSGSAWGFAVPRDGHGISLPDGRVFERISGSYMEKLALDTQSGKWNYAVAGGTANALTINLTPAPTTLVAGLAVRLKVNAANTGATTLNVNGFGAKAIVRASGDPLQENDIVAGQVVDVIYDGTVFQVSNLNPALLPSRSGVIFSTVGVQNWVVPTGVMSVKARLWGGGGGGGGGALNAAGAGGGGGGYAEGVFAVMPGETIPVTVGSGGLAGSSSGSNGGAGGTSSFGTYVTVSGGTGGGGSSTGGVGGTGGTGTGGQFRTKGQGAADSYSTLSPKHGSGGAGAYGTPGSGMSVSGGIVAGYPGGGGGASAGGFNAAPGGAGLIVIEY